MRESKLDRMRAAYFGPLTAAQIAGGAGVGEKWLRRFWAREKAAGRLPDQRRPHFLARCKCVEPSVAALDDAITDVSNDAPIGEPNPTYGAQCAASLEALRRHHPQHDNALAQTAPRDWLVRDADPFYAPSCEQLRAMARAFDQRVPA